MIIDIEFKFAIINLLAIVGINKATEFRYCTPMELVMKSDSCSSIDYCDKRGIDKHSKYVLWFIRYYSDKIFGQYLSKPICTCIPCMGSVWGTIGYCMTHPLSLSMVPGWITYVLMICGMGAIIDKYING